jgi:DNA-binding transcriptional regulator YhcF (GntR family)
MPNDFIGDLSKTRFFDLMKPLLDRKKSGLLLVKGDELGEVYIEGGGIIHAKVGPYLGEDAILAMMEWDSGRVTFDWQASTEEQTVFMPTEQLLMIWIDRENEWKKVKELIPSSDVIFQIPFDGAPEVRNIPAIQWKILALCNGSRTVYEIAESLKWQIFETSKVIYQMVQDGFLEKSSEKGTEKKLTAKRTVNGNFFSIIENELRKIMGPMAPIIIDDKIEEFGESREAFPEDQLPPFVQAITDEIMDKTKRALFNKSMTEFIARKQK